MKKALITGIAGFAGSHLAEYLLSKEIQVFGFFHPDHSTENVNHLESKIELISTDILNSEKVTKNIKSIIPDLVFHLAAFSSPAKSFKDPKNALENNIIGQLNLLDSLVKIKSSAKILIIGSADEYGNVEEKFLPVNESTPFSPTSPYAVSKVTQDMLGLQYFLHNKLQIIRVRPFNHIGPRQSNVFVVPAFASQIAAIEKSKEGTIKVGNLDSFRDFTDVRDMVKAYFLALEKGIPGEVYNIGSGKAVKIADILDMLVSFSKAKIKIETEKSRLRKTDIKSIYCDYSKFKSQTEWVPKTPLLKTLSDTIEYERKRLN